MATDSMYIFTAVMLSNCLLLVMLVVIVYKARKSRRKNKKRSRQLDGRIQRMPLEELNKLGDRLKDL